MGRRWYFLSLLRGVDGVERVVMFVKFGEKGKKEGEWDVWCKTVKGRIREMLSPRHVPAIMVQVEDIPVCLFYFERGTNGVVYSYGEKG